jgi:hypothetical protein
MVFSKYLIRLSVFLLLGRPGSVDAQTFDEWFQQDKTQIRYLEEQVLALKAFGKLIDKGYGIATKGLWEIDATKRSDYRQHEAFIRSLWAVSHHLKGYARIAAIKQGGEAIEKNHQHFRLHLRSGALDQKEILFWSGVFAGIREQAAGLVRQLNGVLTDGYYQLTDNERLTIIDSLYADMKELHYVARSLATGLGSLVANRYRELMNAKHLWKLHGLK